MSKTLTIETRNNIFTLTTKVDRFGDVTLDVSLSAMVRNALRTSAAKMDCQGYRVSDSGCNVRLERV